MSDTWTCRAALENLVRELDRQCICWNESVDEALRIAHEALDNDKAEDERIDRMRDRFHRSI